MALVAPLSRSRLRSRLDPLTINVPTPSPALSSMEVLTWANCQGRTNNTSPTRRSQRRDETVPKRHYNMFDQTLLPEEDFSGGKLLRKRKTSGASDESQSLLNKRRRTLPPSSAETQPQTASNNSKFDQIEVSTRPRPVPQESTASQTTEPTRSAAPSAPLTPQPSSQQREFRTRDKTINYTIPSLKSLLPPPLNNRRSWLPIPTPKSLDIPNRRPPAPDPLTADTPSPRVVGRPPKLTRTVTQRNGEKSLLLKLHIAPVKLGPLVHKQQPRIRIVESSLVRKRRIEEVQEDVEEAEPKRESEKPFGGILSKEDADTSKTMPMEIDRNRFDRARAAALVCPSSPHPLPSPDFSPFGFASD